MRALLAIILDTWHMLSRRRLYWLHLLISSVLLLLLASVSCNADGYSLLFGARMAASDWLKDGTPWEATLHCWAHARFLRWWVAGGALFMALFATASIMPQTLESGAAALLVPKARRRFILLMGRYLGCIGYAAIHTLFCLLAMFLIWRWRMGVWHGGLFLALPIIVLLFAALQAVATLIGVITKSATAALLGAVLFAGVVISIEESVSRTASNAAEVSNDEDNASGMGELLTHSALLGSAAISPHFEEAIQWIECQACPRPPRSYGALFRRLRNGRTGVAAAAEAIATASGGSSRRSTPTPDLIWVLLSSGLFSLTLTGCAHFMLRRRDL